MHFASGCKKKIQSLLMGLILGFCSGMLNHYSLLRLKNSQRGKLRFLHRDHKNSPFCTQVQSKLLPGAKFIPCHVLDDKRKLIKLQHTMLVINHRPM